MSFQPPTAAKKPFWTRTKVGLTTGVAGVILGTGFGASSADMANQENEAALGKSLRAALADKQELTTELEQLGGEVDGLSGDLDESRADASAAAEDAQATLDEALAEAAESQQAEIRKAVKAAVAKTRKQEQAKTAAAVAAAKAAATKAASNQSVTTFSSSGSAGASGEGTDPRFSYCYEANDAGYGNYVRGRDPEYHWYDDNDNDGVVCET